MTAFRQENDRPSMGVDEPAKAKNIVVGDELGYLDRSVRDRRDQDAIMYRAGYDYAYEIFMPRILELEDQLRYFIRHSVTQMFHDIGFDGADSARKRSAQRFRQWWHENYREERDAA